MKRRYFILLFSAALTAVLSPCVEALSYAIEKESCAAETSCCSKMSSEGGTAEVKPAATCCSKLHSADRDVPPGGKSDGEAHGQCSSLCHCNCCAHVVTAFYAFIPVLQTSPVFRIQPEFYSQYHFDYSNFIWQPPRLG